MINLFIFYIFVKKNKNMNCECEKKCECELNNNILSEIKEKQKYCDCGNDDESLVIKCDDCK